MDIKRRVHELAERWFSSPDLREILHRDVTTLIREAVAESEAEWKAAMEGLDAENEGCLKRQGLRRINHVTESDPATGFDVVDFWLAPPPGHILSDDGVVRKVLGTLPILASGEIVGNGATVYNAMHLGGDVMAHLVFHDGISWGHAYAPCFTISCGWDKCYSTREAAIAASKEPR